VCGDGEGGPFVDGASRIALDGELPLNTYGGQLSAGRMHGYWVLHEACVQLRGQAGEREVVDDLAFDRAAPQRMSREPRRVPNPGTTQGSAPRCRIR
jgi:thiolase-like protein